MIEPTIYGAPTVPADLQAAVMLMDKPKGWSSFDVIRRLRRTLGVRKIGHAGTLDPMATGLLICCVNRATKQVNAFMGMEKEYTGTLRLGQTTASYDAESDVVEEREWAHVTDALLSEARHALVGDILQQPPMYSAVKVGGERLYKKARRGETIERPPRHVHVAAFELTDRRGRDVDFRIRCSKGTYIRTLAHDLGHAVNAGAHLVALRRTAIGAFRVDDAWTPAALHAALHPDEETAA